MVRGPRLALVENIGGVRLAGERREDAKSLSVAWFELVQPNRSLEWTAGRSHIRALLVKSVEVSSVNFVTGRPSAKIVRLAAQVWRCV